MGSLNRGPGNPWLKTMNKVVLTVIHAILAIIFGFWSKAEFGHAVGQSIHEKARTEIGAGLLAFICVALAVIAFVEFGRIMGWWKAPLFPAI